MNDELKMRILKDIRVELLDEFDQNFNRKGFFDQPWERRQYRHGRGSLMAVTNKLRRSYRGVIQSSGVSFTSDHPGALMHHKGGKIRITPRMRRFFWAQHYKYAGQMSQTKSGKASNSQHNQVLTDQALYWRNMALHKDEHITIPQRKVVGDHPTVRKVIKTAANEAIADYVQKKLLPILKK